MRYGVILVAALALRCSATPSARSGAAGGSPQRVVAVDPDPNKRPGVVLLRWEGEFEGAGDLYAVVDESGYRGLVRTRGKSSIDCDHCPGPLIEAELLEGPGPAATGAVAVGPVARAMPKARLGRVARGGEQTSAWRPVLRLDLDGDGSWDLVESERCGHSVRSGCAGEVCDMTCTGVAPNGREPDPREMQCRSFVPDLDDCEPR